MPVVAANWKMNPNNAEDALDLVRGVLSVARGHADRVEVAIFPPFPWLMAVAEVLAESGVKLGAQDCFWELSGAYTGEVSPAMLKGWCDWVITGHSERRIYLGETDEMVSKKTAAALGCELNVIMCVGELADHYDAGTSDQVVSAQVKAGLANCSADDSARLVIAYETVGASGYGKSDDTEDDYKTMRLIRRVVGEMIGAGAYHLPHHSPDQPHRFVSVLRVGTLAGADRPHRLVRDHQAGRIVGRTVGQARLDLRAHDLVRGPGVVVVGQLPDAHDHVELAAKRGRRLPGHHLIRLAKVDAALRVAGDDPVAPTLQHRGRDLARIRTRKLPEAVLRTELHAGLGQHLGHGHQPGERRKDGDLDAISVSPRHRQDAAHQVERVLRVVRIHLPVCCHDRHRRHPAGHLRLLQDRDAGQLFAFQVFERRATPRRDVGEAPGQAERLDGRDRVAAADQRVAAGACDRLADRLRPIAEIADFRYSHGPVPNYSAGAEQSLTEQRHRFGPDVERHPTCLHRVGVHDAQRLTALHPARAYEIDRKQQLATRLGSHVPSLIQRRVLDEPASGRVAARPEEGVRHGAPDDERVDLVQEVAQDPDLGRDLGAADHRDHRPARVVQRLVQSRQLGLHQLTREGGQVSGDSYHRCMRPL